MQNELPKRRTHFDQIPIHLAKKRSHAASHRAVPCAICGTAVTLENCNINEIGAAVHAECYFRIVSFRAPLLSAS